MVDSSPGPWIWIRDSDHLRLPSGPSRTYLARSGSAERMKEFHSNFIIPTSHQYKHSVQLNLPCQMWQTSTSYNDSDEDEDDDSDYVLGWPSGSNHSSTQVAIRDTLMDFSTSFLALTLRAVDFTPLIHQFLQ